MKRAAVWQDTGTGRWYVDVCPASGYRTGGPIESRCAPVSSPVGPAYRTHARALEVALEAVGLTPANPEPMEAP